MLLAPTSAQDTSASAFALDTLMQVRVEFAARYPDYKLTLALLDKTIDATAQQIDPNYVSTTLDRKILISFFNNFFPLFLFFFYTSINRCSK
jgi:hypothetical protein